MSNLSFVIDRLMRLNSQPKKQEPALSSIKILVVVPNPFLIGGLVDHVDLIKPDLDTVVLLGKQKWSSPPF